MTLSEARALPGVPGPESCPCSRVMAWLRRAAVMQEPAAFTILGLTTGSEIIRKPRASCSRIRRLCCSAWRACRSPMRRLGRTARWRYGRSPVIRPRRHARTAGRSQPAVMTPCWPGREMSAAAVTRWRCGGSSTAGNARRRAARARPSPSGCRRCRRAAGSPGGCGSRPPLGWRNGGSRRRRRPGTPGSRGRWRMRRSPPRRPRCWGRTRRRRRTWASMSTAAAGPAGAPMRTPGNTCCSQTGGTPASSTCPGTRGCWARSGAAPPMTPRTGWPRPPPPGGTRSGWSRSTCAPSMPPRCAGCCRARNWWWTCSTSSTWP